MSNKKDAIKNDSKASKNNKDASYSSHSQVTQTLNYPQNSNVQEKQEQQSDIFQPSPSLSDNQMAGENQVNEKKSSRKTRITVKYDVGFPNQLYIRGTGANLSWEKGQLLKNVKPDEWVWETELLFTTGEFKVLINDRFYEIGDNHRLNGGSTLLYTPKFNE